MPAAARGRRGTQGQGGEARPGRGTARHTPPITASSQWHPNISKGASRRLFSRAIKVSHILSSLYPPLTSLPTKECHGSLVFSPRSPAPVRGHPTTVSRRLGEAGGQEEGWEGPGYYLPSPTFLVLFALNISGTRCPGHRMDRPAGCALMETDGLRVTGRVCAIFILLVTRLFKMAALLASPTISLSRNVAGNLVVPPLPYSVVSPRPLRDSTFLSPRDKGSVLYFTISNTFALSAPLAPSLPLSPFPLSRDLYSPQIQTLLPLLSLIFRSRADK